jgi:hypothetical protein
MPVQITIVLKIRCPGADVNPYLSFAATLASGYLGMQHKIKPTDAFEGNAYNSDVTFSRSLQEALDALEASKEIKGCLVRNLFQSIRLLKTFNLSSSIRLLLRGKGGIYCLGFNDCSNLIGRLFGYKKIRYYL